jgi:hypothetical protein
MFSLFLFLVLISLVNAWFQEQMMERRLTFEGSFVPEGIVYDERSTSVFVSSINFDMQTPSTIRRYPMNFNETIFNTNYDTTASIVTLNDPWFISAGLDIIYDLADIPTPWVVAAVNNMFSADPANAAAAKCGISIFNGLDGSSIQNIDLSSFRRMAPSPPLPCFVNDVAINTVTKHIFVTDFFGYQVFAVPYDYGANGIGVTVTATDAFLVSDDFNILRSTGEGFNGPNGVEYFPQSGGNGWMVVGVSPNQFARFAFVDPTQTSNSANQFATGSVVSVDFPDQINGVDGIILDKTWGPDSWMLYVAGGNPNANVTVLRFSNNAQNAEVVTRVSPFAGITTGQEVACTTIARLSDTNEFAPICNNNFAAGPYDAPTFTSKEDLMKAGTSPSILWDNFSPGTYALAYDAVLGNVLIGSLLDKGIFGVSGRLLQRGEENVVEALGANDRVQYWTPSNGVCKSIIDMMVDPENHCYLWLLCPSVTHDANGDQTYNPAYSTNLGMINLCDQNLGSNTLSKTIPLTWFDTNQIIPKSFAMKSDNDEVDADIFIVANTVNEGVVYKVEDIYDQQQDFYQIPGDFGTQIFGVEIFLEQLIVGSDNGIRVMDIDDNGPVTTLLAGENAVANTASLRFNSDKSFLFMTKSTNTASAPSEVVVLTSSDGWRTNAGVSARIQIDCNRGSTFSTPTQKTVRDYHSRVVSIPANNAESHTSPWGEDLAMLCSGDGYKLDTNNNNNQIDLHFFHQYMPVLTNSFNANPNLFPDSCDDDEGVDEETFTAVAALAGIFGATTLGLIGYMTYTSYGMGAKSEPSMNPHASSSQL